MDWFDVDAVIWLWFVARAYRFVVLFCLRRFCVGLVYVCAWI